MKVDARLDISDCIFTRSANERKSREEKKNESFGKGHRIVNNRNTVSKGKSTTEKNSIYKKHQIARNNPYFII